MTTKSKHSYSFQVFSRGSWYPLIEGETKNYCLGWFHARRDMPPPKLASRVVRNDGKIIEEFKENLEVGLGMIAGWPTAEQYEAAATRALEKAALIRRMEERRKNDR